MKHRRKTEHCLNCGLKLPVFYNYCPRCGQENDNKHQSLWRLIVDFFSNYFSLDGRFTRSLKPFFLKPGFLTQKFNEGKRAGYANPVRLYLVLSLFYFFVLSTVGNSLINSDDGDEEIKVINVSYGESTVKRQLKRLREGGELEEVEYQSLRALADTATDVQLDSLGKIYSPKERRLKKRQRQERKLDKYGLEYDTTLDEAALDQLIDSIVTAAKAADTLQSLQTAMEQEEDEFILKESQWEAIIELAENRELSVTQVLDSVDLSEATTLQRMIASQTIKVQRNPDYFFGYIFKNLPLMMLLMLPVLALVLKLLYVRRKFYYIDHLVHGLHLHTLAYLLYGLAILITYQILDDYEVWAGLFNGSMFLAVSFYAYKSFRRVYGQGRLKTICKYLLVGFCYSILMFVFLLAETLISFVLF